MVIAKDLASCMRPVLNFCRRLEELFLRGSGKNISERIFIYRQAGRKLSKDKFRQITKELLGKTENDPSYSIAVIFQKHFFFTKCCLFLNFCFYFI